MNLTTGRINPLPVDPEAWARFGHHATPVGTMRIGEALIRIEPSAENRKLVEQMLEDEAEEMNA